jgi:shikimate dehydrogenase
MKHFAVIGNPIAHSRSPEIHQAFAKQTGIALTYQRLEAPVTADGSGFADAVQAFFVAGGNGMNVTAPFKEAAFRLAASVSERSRLAATANTLTNDDPGGWRADNTDGIGLVRDLTGRLGLPLAGRRLLILGAGGASAGLLEPLLGARPSRVVLWNRTTDKAQHLIQRFTAAYPNVALSHFSPLSTDCGQPVTASITSAKAVHAETFDLVIHATSLRKADEVANAWPWLKLLCTPNTFFYDLGYTDDEMTPFLRWARTCGARRWSDGLGMLVEQAAESFRVWHGCLPKTAPVFLTLRLLK